jgi:predicted dehydrogenase
VEVYGTKATARSWFLRPKVSDPFREALRRQADDFAQLVKTSRGGGATARDALAALNVAERAARETR